MAIFFLIVISIFSLITYYVGLRAVQSLTGDIISKKYFLIIFIFLSLTFIIGKVLESFWISPVSEIFIWIGSFWVGILLYSLLFVILIDFVRILNYFLHFFPDFITANYAKTKFITGLVVLVSIIIIMISGFINVLNPKITTLDLEVNKTVEGNKNLNIVAVSDIHMGTIMNKNRTQKLIERINSLKPDIVLIAGDMIDDNFKLVKHYNLLSYFKNINSVYGVYAITGNHEYISHAQDSSEYFAQNNIKMLNDEIIEIDNRFIIVGRKDVEARRWLGSRKKIEELVKDIDFNKPIILLDHQPFALEVTEKNNIDLQISGHTHHGQFWPITLITKSIFEVSYGYLQKGNSHIYVSCGYGTSGLPIRIGNTPEIVNIKLSFN